jgi:hypothetical protein
MTLDVPGLLREGIPGFRSGLWALISWDEKETRVHRGRRFVFGTMRYRDEKGTTATIGVVVKTYRRDPGTRSIRAMEQLWDRGFHAPSFFRVPRPLGRVPESNVLILEWVLGTPWNEVVKSGAGEDAGLSAGAAGWLVRLHSGPVVGVTEQKPGNAPPTAPPRPASRLAGELLRKFPGWAPLLEPVFGRLLERLPEAGGPVPSHGDFHPDNVFISPGAVTAIDFDNFGSREAGYDVGYAIGQLLIMSRLRSGDFRTGARAAADFWRRYEDGGVATPDRVGVHVARTFVQSLHYELVTFDNGRVDLIEPWTDQIDLWLRSEGPETLESLIRHS